jgi:glycosyltransferase involved in cell wall biosynthesis
LRASAIAMNREISALFEGTSHEFRSFAVSRPLRIQLVRQTGMTAMHNIVTLTNYFSDVGCSVRVVCVEPGTENIEGLRKDITITGLGVGQGVGSGKLLTRLRGGLRLRKHLSKQVFDFLYVTDSWTLPTLWLATCGRLRWVGAKTIYHTYDWLEPDLVAELHRRLERRMCHCADLVVNTDRSRARMQRTIYGLKTTPLWIQNCLSGTTQIPPSSEALRREMTGSSDASSLRIVIYPTIVSNADSAQRMAWELIQAFRRLPEQYRLVLFYREGAEYRRCLHACIEAGLVGRVTFMERMPFLRLLEYVVSADVGAIFYDDRQSSGYFMCNPDKLSLFAACGIPYVASDQPNLEAVTYRYGMGECCDPRDTAALTAAILNLVEGVIPLLARKVAARQAFLSHLNFEVQGRRLLHCLESLHLR